MGTTRLPGPATARQQPLTATAQGRGNIVTCSHRPLRCSAPPGCSFFLAAPAYSGTPTGYSTGNSSTPARCASFNGSHSYCWEASRSSALFTTLRGLAARPTPRSQCWQEYWAPGSQAGIFIFRACRQTKCRNAGPGLSSCCRTCRWLTPCTKPSPDQGSVLISPGLS